MQCVFSHIFRLSSDSADDDKANISVSCPPANKIKYKQKPDFSVPECDICKKTLAPLIFQAAHTFDPICNQCWPFPIFVVADSSA